MGKFYIAGRVWDAIATLESYSPGIWENGNVKVDCVYRFRLP